MLPLHPFTANYNHRLQGYVGKCYQGEKGDSRKIPTVYCLLSTVYCLLFAQVQTSPSELIILAGITQVNCA